MPNMDIADPGPLAVPRKLGAAIRQRKIFVGNLVGGEVTDQFHLRPRAREIRRAGNVDHRWHIKAYVCQRFTDVRCIEQCFEIEAAPGLETRLIGPSTPIRGRSETAQTVAPFTSRDVEGLV